MSEQNTENQELQTALRELCARWLATSQEAERKGRQLTAGNVQQALYQRGLAEGLVMALKDVEQILAKAEQPTEQVTEEVYPFITREAAIALLGKIGLHITELHQHEDHTFSAMLPPLQALSFEERIHKLNEIAEVVILAKGRLPASNKAYIDFAFRKLPSP